MTAFSNINRTDGRSHAHTRPGRAPRAVVSALLACALAAAPLALSACGATGVGQDAGSQQTAGSSESSQVADFRNPDLGNGWQVERSMELEYAKNFSVDYYQGGYKLACLSDGTRYLVVPKGKKAPNGLADDIVVLHQSDFENIYLVASDTGCLFDALGDVGKIGVSGIQQSDWYIDSIVSAMKSGKIAYGGKYNTPDYDRLLSHKVKFAIESTMINHTPDVKEKLEDLGIKVMTEQSSYETEPLGRTEWVKLYGALFGQEKKADAVFAKQEKAVNAVKDKDTGKTVAFFYINSNGQAVVRKPGDYVTKMIDQAGGEYINKDLDDTGTSMSTVTLEMEKFYATAKDADYIVYNATIDGGVKTVDQLVAKNSLLADFKAVKSGDVWCTDQNMYQQMVETGSIIQDFHEMLSGTSKTKLDYLYKLK